MKLVLGMESMENQDRDQAEGTYMRDPGVDPIVTGDGE